MKNVIPKLYLNPRHLNTSTGIQEQRPVQSKASAPAKEVGIAPILQRMKHSTIRRRFLCFWFTLPPLGWLGEDKVLEGFFPQVT